MILDRAQSESILVSTSPQLFRLSIIPLVFSLSMSTVDSPNTEAATDPAVALAWKGAS